jgi:hypothetical protein
MSLLKFVSKNNPESNPAAKKAPLFPWNQNVEKPQQPQERQSMLFKRVYRIEYLSVTAPGLHPVCGLQLPVPVLPSEKQIPWLTLILTISHDLSAREGGHQLPFLNDRPSRWYCHPHLKSPSSLTRRI